MAVVRTTNERPRQPKIPQDGGGISTLHYVRDVWFWPSHFLLALFSHLALPVLRKDTPRAHTCCKAYAGSRAREPMYGRRIVQWTRRLPCAACMHAAEACVRACVRAWISGHPLRKAPTVDRTAPGIVVACHGIACPCSSNTAYYCVYSQELGSAGVAEESESYELGPARVLCANTSSFRCGRSRRMMMMVMAPTAGEVHSTTTKTSNSLAVPTMPAADAGRRGRACQLPVHGPVRRAARARSTSHHFLTLLHFDASRICMRAERQASSCASAPQPAKLNPTPAVILSLGPRLARRFARSLHLHPYN